MSQDPFAQLKQRQREMWASFGPTALFTTPVAGHVVRFADIAAGEAVLDVGTGTGVLAITAARRGAKVSGLDLTPELLAQARENAAIARLPDLQARHRHPSGVTRRSLPSACAVANGWLAQNPSINGYSGAFGYHLDKGVTIVVAATKGKSATSDGIAFDILRDVTKYVTPDTPINF